MQLLFTSLFSLFWSFSVVPSNSFQTDSFLPTVPAVCSNTYCIAPSLPATTWEPFCIWICLCFTLATDKQTSKTKKCPCLNSAAYSNVHNFYHNEVQGVAVPCMLGVKLRQSSKAEQDLPVHSPTGEVQELGSRKMGSSLAWDGCWRLLLTSSAGGDPAAVALRDWKQGDRLSSALILLCWPTPLVRWPGLGQGW